jgi:cellulose biosynthesis protein BcsQ
MEKSENMADQVPSLERAWQWLMSYVPEDYRAAIVLTFMVLIIIAFLLNQATALLRFSKAIREWWNPTPRALPLPPDEMPKPKVSFWSAPVRAGSRIVRPSNSIPIVTVAAMKGGVGKTTLTANLAAYLDGIGKRVLLIDFDYQGSLSHMVTSAANMSLHGSEVDELISRAGGPDSISRGAKSLQPALQRSKIMMCYYQFSDIETEEMIEWVCSAKLGKPTDDIRFRLERILFDPEVQSKFDVILIDAPPRFSTGAINALCASTHMIIPTVLDNMSAEAAVYFSQDIAAMRQELFPSLRLVGVVPTLTYQEKLSSRELDVVKYLNDSLRRYWGGRQVVLKEALVPRKNSIGDVAGKEIGYLNAGTTKKTREVREIFDRVGAEIWSKIVQQEVQ